MNGPVVVEILGAALVAVLGLAVVAILVQLRRTRGELEQARLEALELRSRVDLLAAQVKPPPEPTSQVDAPEFLITGIGQVADEPPVPTRIEGRLFADIVLRETVLRAASLSHGVRRALSPESRNRIRFEMKREVKRSRKQRRADTKAALREWEARQRAGLDTADEDAA
ncbi:hypothetical protein [Nocardioides sp.]|uniref:hypothetical protein n=1 Tax=Nocardioides sp. TaxID=35761 RepID=UPI003D0E451E